ncbi:MAG TPA: YggT family protein [Solirubrobacteraceae bacterium]|jgi:uncharacterized protein YggT (Ycf19 family)|nr:YggT family protein [Solirubrobacteraceae bacterium]
MSLLVGTLRTDVADYLSVLLYVYSLLIFAYILTTFIFAFGVRMPYSRTFDAVLTFLRDVCEPYLGLFRRFIPPLGPLDLSPMVALFVLYFVGGLLVSAIHG